MSFKNKGNSFLKQENSVVSHIYELGFQRVNNGEWADSSNVLPHDCCF